MHHSVDTLHIGPSMVNSQGVQAWTRSKCEIIDPGAKIGGAMTSHDIFERSTPTRGAMAKYVRQSASAA